MRKNEKNQVIKEQKTRRITFRLSESEYARVADDLQVCGLTLSAFARKSALGQRVASKADLAVLAELRRLGGLLKHIHNETLGIYSDLTAQAIRDLSAYARVLSEKHAASSNLSKELHR